MTSEKLTSLQNPDPEPPPPGKRRIPATLLPIGLLLAFIVIFGVMFGGRLIPARAVTTASVIALQVAGRDDDDENPQSGDLPPPDRNEMLFQSSGWVEPDPYPIHVPALINGVVRDVHVLEGQAVNKGDILATLIDEDAVLDVQQAKQAIAVLDANRVAHCAQLPVLNAEMHAVRKRIESAKALHTELLDLATRLSSVPPGSVSAREVRQAELKAKAQAAVIEEVTAELAGVMAKINKVDLERIAVTATISSAQTELARKQLALERTVIRAPLDGIVLHLHAAPGKKRMLTSDDPKSANIVELYERGKLQARIDVPLSEASALRVGQPVTLTTELLPDTHFTGEVTRIAGEADLQRNTLQAKVRLREPDARLRPEMLVRAAFHPGGGSTSATTVTSGSRQGLAIFAPQDALLERSLNSARAWVVEEGRARIRILKLGTDQREGHIQVMKGLRPGDQVVLPPFGDLKDNQRIRITNQS